MVESGSPSYVLVRWLFLRLLGIVYFIAFASSGVQILGLIGSQGILPVADMLAGVGAVVGPERYWLLPTLAWLDASDFFLQFLCWAGAFFALLVVFGVFTAPALFLCWLFYLSLVTIGLDFMSFQWDALLLETGFLSMFFAPWQVLAPPWKAAPAIGREPPPSPVILWLLRWLLFRLMFMSGCVKLLSGDESWRNLTAMAYHYWTQPLPTPPAWYFAQLPVWLHRVSTVMVFVVELAIPFLIFAPRRSRFLGAGLMIGLQILIAVTGNYTYFNLLTVLLCLLLFDDEFVGRFVPSILRRPIKDASVIRARGSWRRYVIGAVTAIIVVGSVVQLSESFFAVRFVRTMAAGIAAAMAPFHIVNSYGLFAVMTTTRPEIIIEGSRDGRQWLAYEFKYKPGDVRRPPPWVAPYQPRLDWQMWFAALGSYHNNPWFVRFLKRLLEGSPPVLALLEKNPFAGTPPRYIRARTFDYRFTTWAEKQASGAWWRRELSGIYFPEAKLEHF